MPRNFTDKALWLTGNAQVNNINASQLGQISLVAPGPIGYGGQDDWGKRVELSNAEIANFTNTTNGTLYGGTYQLVQVDSGATAANVKTGTLAFTKVQTSGSGVPVVTSEDKATSDALIAGVFLNSITPGNYGAICVAGDVNILFASSLTNAGTAIGDIVGSGKGSGAADDIAAKTGNPTGKAMAVAVVAPTASQSSRCHIDGILYQV